LPVYARVKFKYVTDAAGEQTHRRRETERERERETNTTIENPRKMVVLYKEVAYTVLEQAVGAKKKIL